MQKATSKAYVSMRKLDKYKQERARQQQKDVKSMPLQMVKEECVEESIPDIDKKILMDAQMKDEGEEDKRRAEEEDYSDDSAEGVDSDDLADEINNPVEEMMNSKNSAQ